MSASLAVILAGWMLAGGSPGPATLAISGTSMDQGRGSGLRIACGILCGSACWGIASGLGIGGLMLANAWVFEVIRYAGAGYLLYLAIKSLLRAWRGYHGVPRRGAAMGSNLFFKGMLLHLTNPKAVLSWGSIYAIALPSDAGFAQIALLFAALISASCTVFLGYALLFSHPAIARGYRKTRRLFDVCFGLLFGAASLKILTVRVT